MCVGFWDEGPARRSETVMARSLHAADGSVYRLELSRLCVDGAMARYAVSARPRGSGQGFERVFGTRPEAARFLMAASDALLRGRW